MNKLLILVLVIASVIALGVILISRQPKEKAPSSQPVGTSRSDIREVVINKNGFNPPSITIKKGETVKWINRSGQDVSVNSTPHPTHNLYRFLNLGEFPNGSSVQATFQNVGSYSYHNHFNPSQQGTVIVK